jgi:hypothetical protein
VSESKFKPGRQISAEARTGPAWLLSAWRYIGLILLCVAIIASAEEKPATPNEGKVRFYNKADSPFDVYSKNPDRETQAWMRENYVRMQTYSPYFDKRLQWFPNAWAYKDIYAIKPSWDIYKEHPEWILKDKDGEKLYIPWGCKRGTCPQFAGDPGNEAFRAWWIGQARELLDKGYRGIWVDDVNLAWRVGNGDGKHVKPIDPRTGKSMRLEDWQRYFAEFVEAIRAAFPDAELAHNSIWYAGDFDNPSILRQIDAADYINLERGATDKGLTGGTGKYSFRRFLNFVDLVHSRQRQVIMMDYGKQDSDREFGLASWFLINNGNDLMNTSKLDWSAPGSFWRGYGLDLGPALGPREEWRGLLRRRFRCGQVLVNGPESPIVRLSVPSGQRRVDGRKTGTLNLEAREAAIMLAPCAEL